MKKFYIAYLVFLIIYCINIQNSFAALSKIQSFLDGDILYGTELTAEFANIYDNGFALFNPVSANINFAGYNITDGGIFEADVYGTILDVNSNEILKSSATTSAVNEITIKNNATGNNPQIQATGDDTNIGINLINKGTGEIQIDNANIITGISGIKSGCVLYKDADELYIPGNILNVKDKLVFWNSQLTKDVGSPAASTWYYVYLDYSAITKGTEITNTEIITSTTAPSWDEQYKGFYNSDDRCIGCFLTDGASNILSFSWLKSGVYRWSEMILVSDLSAYSSVGLTFQDIDLTAGVPNFGELLVGLNVDLRNQAGITKISLVVRKNGSSASMEIEVGHEDADKGAATIDTGIYYLTVLTDTSQIIEAHTRGNTRVETGYLVEFWLVI